MSVKYALLLIDDLSLRFDSATSAQMRGGQQFRGWDEDRYLLWTNASLTQNLLYAFICANSDPKKSKPKEPKPLYTPKSEKDLLAEKKAKQSKPGSFASFVGARFAEIRKKKGEA